MRRALRCAALTLGVTAGGCVTSGDLVRNAETYNLAVERAQTEMLLVNILRAKDHSPLYLTDMSKLNGSVTRKVTGSSNDTLTTAWNRGGTGPAHTLTRVFGVTPGFEVSENPVFQVDVLSTQEFMQGFLKPVPQSTLAYYLRLGWPADLLFHLLVKEVTLTCKPVETAKPGEPAQPGKPAQASSSDSSPHVEVWRNHPTSADPDALRRFAEFVREVVGTKGLKSEIEVVDDVEATVVGETTEPVTLEELVAAGKEGFRVVHDTGTTSWRLQRPHTSVSLRLKSWSFFEGQCHPGVLRDQLMQYGLIRESLTGLPEGKAESAEAKKPEPGKDEPNKPGPGQPAPGKEEPAKAPPSYVASVVLDLRSPEGVLYYLGQLARLEEESGGSAMIPLSCDGFAARPVFVLRKAACSDGAAACIAFRGETYVMPRRDDPNEKKVTCDSASFTTAAAASGGESTHALSLLQQLIALQKNAKDFGGTDVVRVIGQ